MTLLYSENEIRDMFAHDIENNLARETAERMIRGGRMSLEEIAEYVPSLSIDELKEMEAEVAQLV